MVLLLLHFEQDFHIFILHWVLQIMGLALGRLLKKLLGAPHHQILLVLQIKCLSYLPRVFLAWCSLHDLAFPHILQFYHSVRDLLLIPYLLFKESWHV